jgi:hypothetical protein
MAQPEDISGFSGEGFVLTAQDTAQVFDGNTDSYLL